MRRVLGVLLFMAAVGLFVFGCKSETNNNNNVTDTGAVVTDTSSTSSTMATSDTAATGTTGTMSTDTSATTGTDTQGHHVPTGDTSTK